MVTLILGLSSCEKDDSFETTSQIEQNTDRISIKTLTYDELKNSSFTKNHISNFTALNNMQGRGSDVGNFEIDTTYAKYIEKPGSIYHSYTYQVLNTVEEGLQNLVFSSRPDGNYDLYLVKYDISETEKSRIARGEKLTLNEDKTIYYLLDEGLEYNPNDTSSRCIRVTMTFTECTGPGEHPGGYEEDGTPCEAHNVNSETITSCSGASGTGGSGGPGDGGNNTGSPSNNYGAGGSSSNNNNNDIETTPTISIERQRRLHFLEELSPEERTCFQNNLNSEQTGAIYNFLESLDDPYDIMGLSFAPEKIAFAKEAIKAKCENSDAEVDFEDRIINELVGKEKCLDEHLKESGNNFVQDLLANFEGDDSEFGINIKSKDQVFYTDENGNTIEVNGKTRYTSTSNIIKIEISTSKVQNNRALQVVRTLLHEYIHADIFRKLNTQPPSNDDLIFRNTYNSFEDNNFEPTPAHETMASLYVNSMKEALKSYHMTVMTGDYNYLSNNGQLDLDNFYEALAWQGLKNHNVEAWQNMPQNQKDEIDQAYQQYIFATTHNCPN